MPPQSSNSEDIGSPPDENIIESETSIKEGISRMRQILKGDKLLKFPDDDSFLVRFLRARKYNVERAAALVKKFFVLRGNVSDMISLMKPSLHKNLYESGACSILKQRDSKGRHVMLLSAKLWDPSKYSFDEFMAASFMILDEALISQETQLNGVTFIGDYGGYSFSHLRSMSLRRMKTVASIMQDSYPVRFKEYHVINQPALFNVMYSVIKPFLKEKIKNRIHLHGSNYKSLHDFMEPKYLPKRFGGDLDDGHIIDVKLIGSLLEKDEYFEDLARHGYK